MFSVRLATGEMCCGSVDFELRGFFPFILQRTYRSGLTRSGKLGFGWSWPWDITLRREADRYLFEVDGGVTVESFLDAGAAAGAARRSDAGGRMRFDGEQIVVTRADGFTYRFVEPARARRASFAVVIEDRWGNRLFFENGTHGPDRMTDTCGRRLRFSYDRAGRVTAVDLVEGGAAGCPSRLAAYEYDSEGDLVAVVDRCGARRTYRYADHLLIEARNARGGSYLAAYDGDRRCVRKWRSDGRLASEIRYDKLKGRVLVTDGLGYSTLYRLNDREQILEETAPDGERSVNSYDERGGLLAVVNEIGAVSMVNVGVKDGTQRVTMVDGSGLSLTQEIDLATGTRKIVDGAGGEWIEEYGPHGELRRTRSPLGAVREFTYDPRGTLIAETSPSNNTLRIESDQGYRSARLSDDLGDVEKLRWDAEGRMTECRMVESNPERFEYDPLDRVVRLVHPNGASVSFVHDAEGDIVEFVDAVGNGTRYVVSPFGEVMREIGPSGGEVRYEYDPLARLATIVNRGGERLSLDRDPRGRIVCQRFFDGREERYRYDPAGNLVRIEGPGTMWVALDRDGGGRVVAIRSSDGGETRIEYDTRGAVAALERRGVLVTFGRDPEGRPILEEQHRTSIQRQYDLSGNCTEMSIEGLGVRRIDYDLRNRPVHIVDFDGAEYTLRHDLRNRLVSVDGPDGLRFEATYLPENRVARSRVGSARESADVSYRYDASGREIERTIQDGPTIGFGYDPDGNLVERRVGEVTTSFAYTRDGYLRTSPDGRPIKTLPGGQASAVGTVAFDVDHAGRTVRRLEPRGETRFVFDDEDHLLEAVLADGSTVAYEYDGSGRRLGKRSGEGSTRFVWDGDDLVAAIGGNGSGPAQTWCLEPVTNIPLVSSRAGVRSLILSDRTGYPLVVASSSGSVVRDLPEPWGRSLLPEGARTDQPLRFAGQHEDAETGLHYNRHRYYDPTTGRFLTPDPIGINASFDVFAYPTDPVNGYDPSGLASVTPHPCPGNEAAASKKVVPPATETIPDPCKPSRGSSIHNDCINLLKTKAEKQKIDVRRDQMMEFGAGRANRPDVALTRVGKTATTYVEFDYDTDAGKRGPRVGKHITDICANHPGATVYLVGLPQSARFSTTASGGTPSKKGSISRQAGPSESDCGIDKLPEDLGQLFQGKGLG